MPTLAAANGSVNVIAPRHGRRLAVAAAREEAAEAADDVAERDARREHIAGRPQRQAGAADVPERDDDREDQAAVEHAARARQRQQLARIGAERAEVGDEQQQLRADQRADDDVDAEVEHARLVEAARLGADHRELQAEQVGGGQQDAVGVDVIAESESELKQSWIHACLRRACRES